jgi:uncharacterized protein YigA (DUF484 family)
MVKMVVVEVDLGQDINDIINDDIEEMTEQTMKVVDEAIAQKKTVETERMVQAQQKLHKEQKTQDTLNKVYDSLLEATKHDSCLSLEDMAEIARPVITNTSALILQMKSFIRKEKGNAYVLKRRTKNKKPVYILLPFNAE